MAFRMITTALLACVFARAESIEVINPSFEETSRPLAIGEQTNGAGGNDTPVATRFPFGGGGVDWSNPVIVPGWHTRLRPPGDLAINYAGVLHPPLLSGLPFVEGQDGQNVVAVQISRMGQVMNSPLRPNTRYRLRFLGGIGRFGSDYILSASLIAVPNLQTLPIEGEPGVTRLVISQGAVPPPASFGTMLPYSIEYISPRTLPPGLAGSYIGIHMFGSDGIPRVLYDDFRLDATPTPCAFDLDGGGTVALADLAVLLANFGVAGGATMEQGDSDGDGDVDLADLAGFLANFGAACE